MRPKGMVAFLLIFSFLAALALFSQEDEPVEPVNWKRLAPFLVHIPDYAPKGKPEGSTVSSGGFKLTKAWRSYSFEERSLKIEILDGSHVAMTYETFNSLMDSEVNTSEEYVKQIIIKGFSGIERYEYAKRNAILMILVANRFLVQLEGKNFDNISELEDIAYILNLEKLADLAK